MCSGIWFGWYGQVAADWKVEKGRKRKTLLAFRASRVLENFDDLCAIVNYLLLPLLGCASLLVHDGTIPRSRCIPAQRNPRAAFAKFELVRMEVIGDEGMFCLVLRLKLVKGNFAN